jgi:hypothetical protein
MSWIIAIVLAALWVLGFATAHTMGGVIHVLLVIAIATVLIRFIMDRQASR